MISKLLEKNIKEYNNKGFLSLNNFFSSIEIKKIKKEINKVENFSKYQKKKMDVLL